MDSPLQPALLPLISLLAALMVFAAVRACQSAYLLVRDGILQWHARRVLGALQTEVNEGRRTPFELFLHHGMHYLQLGDTHRARFFFEAAVGAHPLSPHGYYGQGLAVRESMYYAGRMVENTLQTALDLDPRHEDARLLLLEFYMQSGLMDEARSQFQQLPPQRQSFAVRKLLDKEPPPSLEQHPLSWLRASPAQKWVLLAFDLAFISLAVAGFFNIQLRMLAAYLLMFLLPSHLVMFNALYVDSEGFSLRTLRARKHWRWSELLDLVELPNGGFFLHTQEGSLFVSRHWNRYGELLTSLKHHLYSRGWMPSLRHYERARWIHPLFT